MPAHSYRFTSIMTYKSILISLVVTLICDARLFKRTILRARPELSLSQDIPNPAGTVENLDAFANNVAQFGDEASLNLNIGNYTDAAVASSSASSSTGLGSAGSTSTDTLDAQVQELINQSNDGLAQTAAAMQVNDMTLDLLRLNVSKLERDVKLNMTRINGLIQDLGDLSTNGIVASATSIKKQVVDLRTDVDILKSKENSFADNGVDVSNRIDLLGKSVASIDARVTAVERANPVALSSGMSMSSSSSNTTEYDSTSLEAVLESWTGRIALAAFLLGSIALVLASMAFSRLPKTAAAANEEVLLETQAVEEQPAEEEEEEEEVYEEEQAEEQA